MLNAWGMGSTFTEYAVLPKGCIRCGACATVAPGLFSVRSGPARVLGPPQSDADVRSCRAAQALCPTGAIVDAQSPSYAAAEPSPLTNAVGELYPDLTDVAEAVRWKLSDLPWKAFQKAQATPGLMGVVREMAYSEQTTFSATQKFMEAFGDDPDFSQWVSVWFYEETRHPLVLLEWLKLAGEGHGDDFVAKGRESQPFMPSRVGTLVMNVLSEMVAAEAYRGASEGVPERLLASIALRLCADEARHAASFFTWARRALERSAQPEKDRLDVLKVLHFWFNLKKNVGHPVNEAMERLKVVLPAAGAPPFVPPNDRIARVIGCLPGLALDSPADVPVQMMAQLSRVQAHTAQATTG